MADEFGRVILIVLDSSGAEPQGWTILPVWNMLRVGRV